MRVCIRVRVCVCVFRAAVRRERGPVQYVGRLGEGDTLASPTRCYARTLLGILSGLSQHSLNQEVRHTGTSSCIRVLRV